MTCDSVLIVQRLAPGGIEMLSLRLARSLPGRSVIVSLEGDNRELQAAWPALAEAGVEFHALGKPAGLSPRTVRQLTALLRRLAPRTVLTHHIGPLLYGGLSARLAGVRNLVHVEHDVWHHAEPRRRLQLRLAALTLRPVFAAISHHAAEAVRQAAGARSVVVLPNGVDIAAYGKASRDTARRALALDDTTKVIGSVGRLEDPKGHDVLIHALSKLPHDIRLVLIGDGSRRDELTALAATLGVTGRIVFAGHRDDVSSLLPAFDVFCLPSRREGLPLVVLEAQASGVPVVATDVGAVRDALCPHTSRLVPAQDVAALAAALSASLAGPPAQSPRRFVEDCFDWDATVRRYTILARA